MSRGDRCRQRWKGEFDVCLTSSSLSVDQIVKCSGVLLYRIVDERMFTTEMIDLEDQFVKQIVGEVAVVEGVVIGGSACVLLCVGVRSWVSMVS